jgi:phage tail sheath protein FI
MAFQLSPGVNVSEVDLTTAIPSVSTTVGAFAGDFQWGPANEIVTISNEVQLVERFGKPDSNTFTSFFTASNFLQYSNDLRVVRSVGSGAFNATTTGTGVLIENISDYEDNHSSGSGSNVFGAKYPGLLGNSLKVSICDSNTTLLATWEYADEFDSNPSTSEYLIRNNSNAGLANDEMHIVVLDTTGRISGTANTILEKFSFVSKASDAKTDDGSSNFYKDVINNRSKYIWWLSHPSEGTNWGRIAGDNLVYTQVASTDYTLSGGVTAAPSAANRNTSYDLFNNPDTVDISFILAGETSGSSTITALEAIAESRKDCIVFISPQRSDVVDNSGSESTALQTFRQATLSSMSSSYLVCDSAWKYQFDKYNDVYRYVPLNGDIAGLCARTDLQRDPWFSPAGINRGQIKNVIKLSWNPTASQRDTLYKNGINPVVTFPGEGTILYGDKTFLTKPSAFDRINVRRLFIVLEKAVARAARSSLFEFNDDFTRAQFVNLVEPFLRDVQGRRGIYDFRVVCDTTNNTAEIIDTNRFVGDIYIKPARSINFIQLNFVATRTGVSFDEIVGRF